MNECFDVSCHCLSKFVTPKHVVQHELFIIYGNIAIEQSFLMITREFFLLGMLPFAASMMIVSNGFRQLKVAEFGGHQKKQKHVKPQRNAAPGR